LALAKEHDGVAIRLTTLRIVAIARRADREEFAL
jgi:hypothetical protein